MKGVKITIEKPCNEDWSQMKPTQRGKFCGTCERDLVDFSILRDAEVFKVIQANEGKVCGRFHKTQMNRNFIQVEERESSKYLKFAASLLLTLAVGNTSGQNAPDQPMQIQVPDSSQKLVEPLQKTIHPYTILGKVYDAINHDPIPFSTVRIKGSSIATMTDLDGNYTIVVPQSMRHEQIIIEVTNVSFNTHERALEVVQFQNGCADFNFGIANVLPAVEIVTLQPHSTVVRLRDEHIMGIHPMEPRFFEIEVKKLHWWQFRKRRQWR